MSPLREALVPDLPPATPAKSPQIMGAQLAGANYGALQRPASVKDAVAKGNPFDVFDTPTAANPFDVFDTSASSNPFDTFDGSALATATENPAEHDPEGTALGRALKRGVLRTRSTLPAIQAQKGATVLSDAALAEPDLIRNVFLETTRLPDVPEGVDISTPELASAAIAQMGYPADFANVFTAAPRDSRKQRDALVSMKNIDNELATRAPRI